MVERRLVDFGFAVGVLEISGEAPTLTIVQPEGENEDAKSITVDNLWELRDVMAQFLDDFDNRPKGDSNESQA
jgi:hypothetical protein